MAREYERIRASGLKAPDNGLLFAVYCSLFTVRFFLLTVYSLLLTNRHIPSAYSLLRINSSRLRSDSQASGEEDAGRGN